VVHLQNLSYRKDIIRVQKATKFTITQRLNRLKVRKQLPVVRRTRRKIRSDRFNFHLTQITIHLLITFSLYLKILLNLRLSFTFTILKTQTDSTNYLSNSFFAKHQLKQDSSECLLFQNIRYFVLHNSQAVIITTILKALFSLLP